MGPELHNGVFIRGERDGETERRSLMKTKAETAGAARSWRRGRKSEEGEEVLPGGSRG